MRTLVCVILATSALLTACATPAGQSAPTAGSSAPGTANPPTTTTAEPTTAPPPPPPPCGPAIRACVSLSTKQAWFLSAGSIAHGPVPISPGAPRSPTPVGTFPVSWKDADNTSSIYGTPMPHSVFFAPGGIAFHEGNLSEDSHGCVRLDPVAAKVFFDQLAPGQLVQIVA